MLATTKTIPEYFKRTVMWKNDWKVKLRKMGAGAGLERGHGATPWRAHFIASKIWSNCS